MLKLTELFDEMSKKDNMKLLCFFKNGENK